ncbi:hypothetical protein [Phenylobacterium sp. J367]|nr:hypothetical protein [Phenylobacterium sp. J367]MCR5876927.1 hypothetical protein [Phenylobacterium sp. J367]
MCVEAEAIGLGDEPIPIGFRATSNRSFVVSFSEASLILRALRAWAAVAQANWWRMKDLVRSAETRADLDAIDLDAGWP